MTLSLGLNEPDPEPVTEPADDDGRRPFATLDPPPPLRARRPAVAFSGIVHLLSAACIVVLVRESVKVAPPPVAVVPAAPSVFLPPPRELRALLGLPPVPRPREARNRVSVGAPSPVRRELVLRPEDDLTPAPQGDRQASGTAGEHAPAQSVAPVAVPPPSEEPGGREAARPRLQVGNAVARAVQASAGRWGDPTDNRTGVGWQFDPQGADFSRWMQRLSDEFYRNFIAPPSLLWGWGGEVAVDFDVARGGAMSALVTVRPSGNVALDRAVRNALLGAHLLPLPDDYAPPQLHMRVHVGLNVAPTETRAEPPATPR